MPSNRSKYSDDMRDQTVRYILDGNRSATSVAEEMGIDTNTV
jgi:transposase-like protein